VVDELVCSTVRVVLMGKPKYSEQNPPFTTFSAINSTWTDVGLTRACVIRGQHLTTWAMAQP